MLLACHEVVFQQWGNTQFHKNQLGIFPHFKYQLSVSMLKRENYKKWGEPLQNFTKSILQLKSPWKSKAIFPLLSS
jgi:hypothetical protein